MLHVTSKTKHDKHNSRNVAMLLGCGVFSLYPCICQKPLLRCHCKRKALLCRSDSPQLSCCRRPSLPRHQADWNLVLVGSTGRCNQSLLSRCSLQLCTALSPLLRRCQLVRLTGLQNLYSMVWRTTKTHPSFAWTPLLTSHESMDYLTRVLSLPMLHCSVGSTSTL